MDPIQCKYSYYIYINFIPLLSDRSLLTFEKQPLLICNTKNRKTDHGLCQDPNPSTLSTYRLRYPNTSLSRYSFLTVLRRDEFRTDNDVFLRNWETLIESQEIGLHLERLGVTRTNFTDRVTHHHCYVNL